MPLDAPPQDGIRSQLLESFARSGLAILVLDEKGEVLHRSDRLERLLDAPGSEDLRTRLHEVARIVPQLGPSLRSEDGTLDLRVSMSLRIDAEWYRSFVMEMAPGLLDVSRTVVVALVRSWGLPPTPSVLCQRFGLSEREADVALHLMRGRSNKAIAGALGISPNTARNHTARVLQKLGVRRRAEATALLLRQFTPGLDSQSGRPVGSSEG